MTERWDDDQTIPPDGRVASAAGGAGAAPESAGDESFSLRGGLRFLVALAVVILLLSVLCWLVGGPTNQ